MKLFKIFGASALAVGLAFAVPAQAQENYPTSTVRLVVPFPAGGGTDVLAREIADGLSRRLGQPVIVENRPGAGSLIGVDYVAKSKPDGYTLLMASSSYITNVILGDNKPYDPGTDFTPITLVSQVPAVLVVNPKVAAQDLKAFVEDARANPDKYAYASFGDRSQPHLASVILQSERDLKLRHIPYNGGTPAVLATVSGEVDMLMSSVIPVQGQIQAGQLRALAIASAQRSPALPDVPTFAEAGFPYEISTWFGVVAPAGTDKAIIDKLNSAMVDYLRDPAVKAKLEEGGSVVPVLEGDAFAAFIQSEIDRWTRLGQSGLLD